VTFIHEFIAILISMTSSNIRNGFYGISNYRNLCVCNWGL